MWTTFFYNNNTWYNNFMDLKNYKIPEKKYFRKISNERQEVLSNFENEINGYRQASGYAPIKPIVIVMLIKKRFKKADTTTLKWFYAECKEANNFNKYFWWKVKQEDLKLF
jgi:hypothetical protein